MSEKRADVAEHDVSALEEWMNSKVKVAPGTKVVYTDSAGFGLEADVNFATDVEREAVRVPHDLVLTSSRVKKLAEEDEQLQKWIAGKNLTDNDVLHRGLLYLWLEAPASSPWRTYFDNLPKDVGLPFSLSVHEMETLDSGGISIMYPALLRRVAIERAYLKFKKLGLRDIRLEDWLLPHQWISSRALSHPETGDTCVVPVVDLANHSSTKPNTRYEVDRSNGDFLLLKVPYAEGAERAPSGSEELLLDYGDRSSAEFVYNYGFLPEDRTADDFDELFRAFHPGSERIRDVLDPARTTKDLHPGDKIDLSRAYETLLDFFGEEYPQILRVVRLPKTKDESASSEAAGKKESKTKEEAAETQRATHESKTTDKVADRVTDNTESANESANKSANKSENKSANKSENESANKSTKEESVKEALAEKSSKEESADKLDNNESADKSDTNKEPANKVEATDKAAESSRYKFHNDFVMAIAAQDHLEVREVDGRMGLFVDDAELTPTTAFEVVMKTQNQEIIRKARQLVCGLCRVFGAQLEDVPDMAPMMTALANRERELYEQYASIMAESDA